VGNRGSKSVIFKSINFIVKEQRVNGSCFIKFIPLLDQRQELMKLRCTLLGNERSYQVKIPSNQIIQRRFYSIEPFALACASLACVSRARADELTQLIEPWFITGFTDAEGCFLVIIRNSKNNKLGWQQNSSNSSIANSAQLKFVLDPWFITGFTDGEGCLGINIYKDNAYKTGWRVKLFFEIHLHKKDTDLLQKIKENFNVGKVYNSKPNSSKYFVTSIADLQVIKNHFNNYPLHQKKFGDFELFKQALDLVQNKEHLTLEGFKKIISIRASMNLGLPDELKSSFPDIMPVNRPIIKSIINYDPYWLAGFTSAEGSFLIKKFKAKTKLGVALRLVFQLVQHARDEKLMKSLIVYFGCGYIYNSNDAAFVYQVSKFSDIYDKIIPFFNKHQIQGVKLMDYRCQVAELMKNKAHTTQKGLENINQIKARINKGRSSFADNSD
jgi:hypothetical protein